MPAVFLNGVGGKWLYAAQDDPQLLRLPLKIKVIQDSRVAATDAVWPSCVREEHSESRTHLVHFLPITIAKKAHYNE